MSIHERNQAIKTMLRKQTEYLESLQPEEAKAYARWKLMKTGIYISDGSLHKDFGGE